LVVSDILAENRIGKKTHQKNIQQVD